jgi:EF hand
MKIKNQIMLTILALGASAFIASAQDTNAVPDGPSPGRHGHHPPDPLMLALDTNHDGVIDADEIANASAALIMLDKNGDGKLTRDELRPPRPPQDGGPDSGEGPPPGPPPGDQQGTNAVPGGPGTGMHGHRPPPPLFLALDANHDGVIDADEIANAPAALKRLDKNGDGKLTRDELRPPRPPQDGGPDSGDRPPYGPPPDGAPQSPPPSDL